MSCGRIALERAGIPVTNYYASEIDKHAIAVSKANYPDIVQLGSVTDLINIDWKETKIDLLIGGSPCQGFSFAGKQLNFEDHRSKLFFEFVRLLEEIRSSNPNVKFFLENVKMKKEYEKIITDILGVNSEHVNSSMVSAQNRKRLYWTNIEGFVMPEDRGIMLRDIVHETADGMINFETDNFNINPSGNGMNGIVRSVLSEKSTALTTNKGEGQKILIPSKLKLLVPEATVKGHVEVGVGDCIDLTFLNSKTRRGRLIKEKSNCLTAANYDYYTVLDLKEFIIPFERTLSILEKEVERGKIKRIEKGDDFVYYIHNTNIQVKDVTGAAIRNQVTKEGVEEFLNTRNDSKSNCLVSTFSNKLNLVTIFGCITPDRIDKKQNGQRFSEGKKFYTLTAQDKHGILVEGYIRKLTPIECERLQTVPENYTSCVSNSQRYKMLGNGWTVDVIVEFFKHLKPKTEHQFNENLDF